MLNSFFYNISEICYQLGLKTIILSPGSRCAPLTIAFSRHPEIEIKTFSDERSAGYMALGMALATEKAVGLVCTSGTATANYLPAITEAYYQNVPLVIFTADRPPEWIDQQDGQAIRQHNIFGNHVKKSFQLPVSLDHPDEKWHFTRTISEAVNLATSRLQGPVHINVPIREPFYPIVGQEIAFAKDLKVIREVRYAHSAIPTAEQINTLASTDKILIIGGQNKKSPVLDAHLSEITKKNIPVIGDIISNLHQVNKAIKHPDNFLGHLEGEKSMVPDLLITFGNSAISKNLKKFIRKNPPGHHWHIQESGQVADPYQSITRIIRATPELFLELIAEVTTAKEPEYFQLWQNQEKRSIGRTRDFFEENTEGEFALINTFLNNLPADANIHLANSMAVRYANFIGLPSKDFTVYANRGTSGIDGSNSTAMGIALTDSSKQNFLITGDMAFLYDRNAFWHNYSYANLKILILNNHGGGIFRIIDGPSKLPELDEFFETRQRSTAKFLAGEFGINYSATSGKFSAKAIIDFIHAPGAAILEYESKSPKNHEIFNKFKEINKHNS